MYLNGAIVPNTRETGWRESTDQQTIRETHLAANKDGSTKGGYMDPSATLLHAGGEWAGEGSLLLLGVVFLASLGTGLLFVVSLFAYRQRRSRRYFLIAVAVGALFTRSIVGAGTVLGYTPMVVHHLIEHTFDFLIAALILYIVLQSGPSSDRPETVSADGGECDTLEADAARSTESERS